MKVDFRTTDFSNKNSKLNGQTKHQKVSNQSINFQKNGTSIFGELFTELIESGKKAKTKLNTYLVNPFDPNAHAKMNEAYQENIAIVGKIIEKNKKK